MNSGGRGKFRFSTSGDDLLTLAWKIENEKTDLRYLRWNLLKHSIIVPRVKKHLIHANLDKLSYSSSPERSWFKKQVLVVSYIGSGLLFFIDQNVMARGWHTILFPLHSVVILLVKLLIWLSILINPIKLAHHYNYIGPSILF